MIYIFITTNLQYILMKMDVATNNDYELKKQKATEQEVGYEFIRINLDKKRIWYFEKYQWNIQAHQTVV